MAERQSVDVNEPVGSSACAAASATARKSPYLEVFGPDTGAFEFELTADVTALGRGESVDVKFSDPTVSRVHAKIVRDGDDFVLEDAGSRHGVIVNDEQVDRHVLRHGDNIEICSYVLQYRTHAGIPGADEAAAQARQMLGTEFCVPPSNVRFKFRALPNAPQGLFGRGDTLKIGRGGLLLPTTTSPGDVHCLELHVFWPNGVNKRYLCENLGTVPGAGLQWMCVKLHATTKDEHRAVVETAEPGEWISVVES